jgi:cobaltochelatase CobN
VALALLPGECRETDARLTALSTVGEAELGEHLACFREGGPENMAAALAGMARLAGHEVVVPAARAVPRTGLWVGGRVAPLAEAPAAGGRPVVPVLFYRSMLLANDHAPVEALVDALGAEGIEGVPVFLPSLRDASVMGEVEAALAAMRPAAVVTATAFAAGEEAGVFERLGVPVFQVVPATTRAEAWAAGARGLAPADLAMHVVLPELDGRILAGAVSFKAAGGRDERLELSLRANRPEPGRTLQVARGVAAQVRRAASPAAERRASWHARLTLTSRR